MFDEVKRFPLGSKTAESQFRPGPPELGRFADDAKKLNEAPLEFSAQRNGLAGGCTTAGAAGNEPPSGCGPFAPGARRMADWERSILPSKRRPTRPCAEADRHAGQCSSTVGPADAGIRSLR